MWPLLVLLPLLSLPLSQAEPAPPSPQPSPPPLSPPPYVGKANDLAIAQRQCLAASACFSKQRKLPLLRWMHTPKTGSSFSNTLFYYACPLAPEIDGFTNGAPVWPPGGLRRWYNNASGCNDCSWYGWSRSRSCGVTKVPLDAPDLATRRSAPHLPVGPHDATKLVGFFRSPRSRLISCFGHVHQMMQEQQGVVFAALFTHGLMADWNDQRWYLDARAAYMAANNSVPVEWLVEPGRRWRLTAVQTRLVLGINLLGNDIFSVQNAAARVDMAISVVHRGFAFVGITERWVESICLFHALLGSPFHEAEFNWAHKHSGLSTALQGRLERAADLVKDPADEALFAAATRRFNFDIASGCAACMCQPNVTTSG